MKQARGWILLLAIASLDLPAGAQQESVANTVHNLSVYGPGEIRSLEEVQVCKFCHVPHSAVAPKALWGHALPTTQYKTPVLRAGGAVAQAAPQPDGSSRLCLSCHDGTVALGDVAGEVRPIRVAGRTRFHPGDRGYIGSDLSGSHPVSFRPAESVRDSSGGDSDLALSAASAIGADGDVRLDDEGKMQCTTCHDPHSDRYFRENEVPRFWVKPSVDEVCAVCHVPD